MAVASSSSDQTTRACSIMTLDGYVSRGKAPPNSVPRDYAMLQDFAEYLEQRLKCLNMSMLRRIFADFLNEQENTLVPMMQQGCTIITIYPVLRTSAQRRQQAELLLTKPKYHLDTRGCVFLYLQYRTATRNMALLKHLFLEFVCKREASLLAFAERGCQVISVIPFELPQMMPPARPPPPPMMQESPRAVDAMTEQRRAVSEPLAKKPTKKRKRKAVPKSTASAASAPADGADQAATLKKARPRLKQTQQKPSAAREDFQIKTKRRRKSASDGKSVPLVSSLAVGATPKRGRKSKASTEPLQGAVLVPSTQVESIGTEAAPPATNTKPQRGRKAKTSTVPPQDATSTAVLEPDGSVATEAAKPTPKHVRKPKTSTVEAASVAAMELEAVMTEAPPAVKPKRGRKAKASTVSLQEAAVTEPVESVVTETLSPAAKSTLKRVIMPRATSTVSLQDAVSVAATEAVESAPMEAPQRSRKTQASTVPLQDAASVAIAEQVEPVTMEAAKSTPKRGRKSKAVPLQDATSATVPVLVEPAVAEAAKSTLKRVRKPKTCTVSLQGTTELVESVVIEAVSSATKSTPRCGKKPKANKTPVHEAASVATTELAERITMDVAESTPKRGRRSKSSTVPLQNATPTAVAKLVESVVVEAAKSTPKRGKTPPKTRTAPLQDAATAAATEVVQSVLSEVVSRVSGEYPKPKRGRKRKPEAEKLKTSGVQENSRKRVKPAVKKSAKRGKPVMSEEMCRSQLELARKMEDFEAQIPWEAAYNNLSPPFDEGKHPALALKFHDFWRKHSHAVWERKFWPPISRKLNLAECNKRNNRQLTAKNAFESLIISAFEELGAQFFVNLDAQTPRHPGWWYRGPVVALFALQQIKGEDTMWNYVMNEALKRFPDCKLPLPLTASNSGAMRIRHKRESVSMWIANHQQTAVILEEMAALKAEVEAGQMAMERTTGELESAGTDSVLL
ncbi:hypothetical protein PI124_g15003 [Phytophthora idaei]|nr:hypothetical protein PI125_g14770 [Phytophthora idaei]KAG3144955.1 hypothetical protein PI126_g13940 [Phytophthora idaei]KAG3240086.1 hypothetical protein PI124_g15003 [Phytophthora idaei]